MAQWEFNRGAALLERLGVAGQADVVNLYAARAARGFGDGFAAIILPAYLLEIAFNATSALLGSAATALAVGVLAPTRWPRMVWCWKRTCARSERSAWAILRS